jgi:hypothetical protein
MTGPEPEASTTPAVSIRAHFERFPATVKGAFVVRGEDPNPHQVAISSARCVSADGAAERPIGLEAVTLDVAPHVNVFVPFELSVSDLAPGWYELVCETKLDGTDATFPGGRRFVVPWPRGVVRRGRVPVGKKLRSDEGKIEIGHVDLAGDSIKVHVATAPAHTAALRLFADGAPLPVLDVDVADQDGSGFVSAYPLLRTQEILRIETDASDPDGVDVALT